MCDMKSSDKSRSTFVAQQMLSDKSRMFVMAIKNRPSNDISDKKAGISLISASLPMTSHQQHRRGGARPAQAARAALAHVAQSPSPPVPSLAVTMDFRAYVRGAGGKLPPPRAWGNFGLAEGFIN